MITSPIWDQLRQIGVDAATGREDQIREASTAWDEAFNAADLEQLMTLYADDAVSMPPGLATLEGKTAIRNSVNSVSPW